MNLGRRRRRRQSAFVVAAAVAVAGNVVVDNSVGDVLTASTPRHPSAPLGTLSSPTTSSSEGSPEDGRSSALLGECGGVDPPAGCLGFFAPPSLAIIGVGTPLAGSDATPPAFECIGGEVASFVGHRATADEFGFDAPPMLACPACTCGGVDAGRAGAGTEAPSLAIATASGVRWIGFAASPASVVSLPESEGDARGGPRRGFPPVGGSCRARASCVAPRGGRPPRRPSWRAGDRLRMRMGADAGDGRSAERTERIAGLKSAEHAPRGGRASSAETTRGGNDASGCEQLVTRQL